ncbi:MAG: alpha/beta hydrolase [Ruminiclostridium sp.]
MRGYADEILNNVTRPECYEEVIIHSNSVPIVLSIWKSRQTDPCIVFFPGTMIHPLIYEDFLNLLCLNGFNVIGVHLISHGKSPRIKKLYSFSDMLQNGKDAITYAINTFNDKVIIMGSSQGGILTIALAGLDNRIKAAFPHNILLPKLPESIYITKFPKWLKHLNKLVVWIIKLGKILTPNLQVDASFYLDLDKITSNKELEKRLHSDPIGLTKYSIYFLSSLFSAEFPHISDGSIKCPVVVIVGKGDPLFPFEYTKKVFDMIRAPSKEMLIFDLDKHLIMTECVDTIIEDVVSKVKEFI